MNKTVTINIAGLLFHIDEDAYTKLSNYLEAIRNSLNTEGKEEIINDIESRIAEIFSEKIDPTSGVVNMNDVDHIIKIMGQPEDYRLDDDNENPEYSQAQSFSNTNTHRVKKLFRDGDNRVIGGVLSGLGNYFNVEPIWIRIIFILLIFAYGLSFIIYPILWIIIPKAKTTADILEMKGEPVNISNIEKAVKENINHLGENIKNIDTQRIREAGTTAGEVIKKVIGITFIIFGILGIMGAFIAFFALNTISHTNLNGLPIAEIIDLGYPAWSASLAIFIMTFIPMLIIFLVGLRLVYKNIKYIGLVSILLGFIWAISIVYFAIIMIEVDTKKDSLIEMFRENKKTTVVKKSLDHITNDTLHIDFVRDPRFYGINDTLSIEESYIEEDNISFEIVPTSGNQAFFEIKTNANYEKNSSVNIGNQSGNITLTETPNMLEYYSNIKENTIEVADVIISKKNNSNPLSNSVIIKLYLPQNKIVRINSSNQEFFNENHIQSGINFYQLKGEVLECISCK